MQEYGWLHGVDYRAMIDVIGKEADSRKLGLAACACARLALPPYEHPRLRAAIELAEDYADFRASKLQVKEMKRTLAIIIEESRAERLRDKSTVPERAWTDPEHDVWWPFHGADWSYEQLVRLVDSVLKPSRMDCETLLVVVSPSLSGADHGVRDRTCELLRDIFGNPFRPATFAPEWRTDTAVALSRTMYDAREFSAMPILADALQDAGCDNDDILAHCRDTSLTHVRGCWVCDLVMGKA